jgi:hypothetical protein
MIEESKPHTLTRNSRTPIAIPSKLPSIITTIFSMNGIGRLLNDAGSTRSFNVFSKNVREIFPSCTRSQSFFLCRPLSTIPTPKRAASPESAINLHSKFTSSTKNNRRSESEYCAISSSVLAYYSSLFSTPNHLPQCSSCKY